MEPSYYVTGVLDSLKVLPAHGVLASADSRRAIPGHTRTCID
jgi:hypothetical protein